MGECVYVMFGRFYQSTATPNFYTTVIYLIIRET